MDLRGEEVKQNRFDIYLILQLIFSIIVIAISIYSFVTENFDLNPISLILLSAILIIMGLREYKRTKKLLFSIFIFGVALFILMTVVYSFL